MTDGIIMLMSIMHLHMHILHRQYGPLTDLVIDRFRKDDATSKQWTPCLLSGMITCGRNVKPMLTPLDVRWFVIDRAVMAYKETETDVLYGVAVDRARWWRIRGLKLTYYMAWQLTAQWWRIKGLKLTYYMAWKWRGDDATAHALLTRGFTF
jgi:hypothetical protein